METPIREYQFNEDNIGTHVQTESIYDAIQSNGGGQAKVWWGHIMEFGSASQWVPDSRAINKDISSVVGKNYFATHSRVWGNEYNNKVWGIVKDALRNKK